MTNQAGAALQPAVWIVEDEPSAGALVADVCEGLGAVPIVFRSPTPYLLALRGSSLPAAVVLDWRLENQLSSGLFLATRHRFRGMPVIYWTAMAESLPAMVRGDELARVVDKQRGIEDLERTLAWALDQPLPSRAQPAESA